MVWAGHMAGMGTTEMLDEVWWGNLTKSDWLRAGRSGDRILVVAIFSLPYKPALGRHPPPYTMGNDVFFPGVKLNKE